MKAVVFRGPGQLSYEDVEMPKVGPGEMLVKTKVALTCGTDVKTFRRGHHLIQPPTLFGHEFAGDVAQVGQGVTRFEEGMRVVAANSAPCNDCFFCLRGKQNLCEDIIFNWGAFAEYVRVPARIVEINVHQIPAHLDYQEAALLEPLACVVLGNEAACISAGDTVVIAGGGGPIGLMHLQLARHNGATSLVVVDLKDSRLDLARQLGATCVINPTREDPVAVVKELTEGRGADVVIETAGSPQVWQLSVELVRKGGTVVWFGGCPAGSRVSLDTGKLHYGELTVRGVFHHTPQTVTKALRLLSEGVIESSALINRRAPLEETQKALEMVMTGEAIKVAIFPD
jgi:L-iditol 2-dehydrogenase